MKDEFCKNRDCGTANTDETQPHRSFGSIDRTQPDRFQFSEGPDCGRDVGQVESSEWDRLQAEYHRRKLALWESGLTGDRFTQECRAIRRELGLASHGEGESTQLDCPRCGPSEYTTRQRGPHTQALCKGCGRHIKFVGKSFDWDALALETEIIPFGIHRGKTLQRIAQEDPKYIRYLAEEGSRKYRALADLAIEEYGL